MQPDQYADQGRFGGREPAQRPGTSYSSLGVLYKGTDFTEYCTKDYKWSYGKVTSGANKGKKGWVKYSLLNPVEKR
ncbi:hypothetical protein SAZ11_16970 [Streptomyces sp. FXJ1.4098]|nr:hypothetical protein [Streptomyces sp. FXJ1.4098]